MLIVLATIGGQHDGLCLCGSLPIIFVVYFILYVHLLLGK